MLYEDIPQDAIHPPPEIEDPFPPEPHAIPLTGAPWPTSSATGCPGLRISSIRTFDSSIPKHASMCLLLAQVTCKTKGPSGAVKGRER